MFGCHSNVVLATKVPVAGRGLGNELLGWNNVPTKKAATKVIDSA